MAKGPLERKKCILGAPGRYSFFLVSFFKMVIVSRRQALSVPCGLSNSPGLSVGLRRRSQSNIESVLSLCLTLCRTPSNLVDESRSEALVPSDVLRYFPRGVSVGSERGYVFGTSGSSRMSSSSGRTSGGPSLSVWELVKTAFSRTWAQTIIIKKYYFVTCDKVSLP